jgi:TetR/AcrR family transcriptional regulator, transcriptional repressor of aconitase
MVAFDLQDPAKERILEHARARFFADGFARVSVDEITSELGMSKKTFYKHFDRKEDLVHSIVARMLGEADMRVQAVLSMQAPFPDKLDALMKLVGVVFKTISKNMLRDLQTYAPEAWENIQTFRRQRVFTTWAALFDEGKRTGYVRPNIDHRVFHLALYSTIEGIINPTVLANESFSADEALQSIAAIFLTGILTPDAAQTFHNLPLKS